MVIMERLPVAVILLSLLKGKFFFFYMLASCLYKNKCTKPVYQENVKKKTLTKMNISLSIGHMTQVFT